jgi:hypothetical protein
LYKEENEIDFDDVEGWYFTFYFRPAYEYEGIEIDLNNIHFDDDDFEGAMKKLESTIEQLNEICDDDYIDNYHTECKDYVDMIRSIR